MPGPESEILDAFAAQLKNNEEVSTAVADRLIELLSADALPQTQVLVDLFKTESGEALA